MLSCRCWPCPWWDTRHQFQLGTGPWMGPADPLWLIPQLQEMQESRELSWGNASQVVLSREGVKNPPETSPRSSATQRHIPEKSHWEWGRTIVWLLHGVRAGSREGTRGGTGEEGEEEEQNVSNRGALFGTTTGVEQRVPPGRRTRDRVRPLPGLR